MARDYKFALYCWQDQYGDENAIANIFVNGTQVATGVEITPTTASDRQAVVFEAPGLADPNIDGSVTADIKVVLTNEAFVDADNDRNIWINGLFQVNKDSADVSYKYLSEANWDANNRQDSDMEDVTDATIADASAFWNKLTHLPTDVQGSQIASTWWVDDALASNDGAGSWYYIPVWGDYDGGTTGTTITLPLKF